MIRLEASMICDRCGAKHPTTHQSPGRVREAARLAGWREGEGMTGTGDLCPGCVTEIARLARMEKGARW